MDIETAGKRARVLTVVQAATSLSQLRTALYFVCKSTVQAAALKADPAPAAADVAALLAAVPAAREILAASQAGRAAIKRADELPRRPATPATPPAPIAAAVAHLRGRWDALKVAPLIRRFPAASSTLDHAIRTLQSVDAVLRDLERMAEAVRSADPQLLADLELLAVRAEDPGESS